MPNAGNFMGRFPPSPRRQSIKAECDESKATSRSMKSIINLGTALKDKAFPWLSRGICSGSGNPCKPCPSRPKEGEEGSTAAKASGKDG